MHFPFSPIVSEVRFGGNLKAENGSFSVYQALRKAIAVCVFGPPLAFQGIRNCFQR